MQTIDDLLAEPLDGRFRAFGVHPDVTIGSVAAEGWNLARRDLPLPALALLDSAVEHNIRFVHAWCERQGVSLAPHGKTSCAPQLIRRQLDAGAWGMTAATVHQVALVAAAGARRVLLANELLGKAEVRWLEAERQLSQDLEIWAFVDSLVGVKRLAEALAACRAQRPLGVLVELGASGSRAGCRSDDEALAVAEAVAADKSILLAGLAAWEGAVSRDRSAEGLARVDSLLARLPPLARTLDRADLFRESEEIVLSAGGSIFLDRVIEQLRVPERALSKPTRIVLRSGCYLTHDHGQYARLSPFRDELRPALQLWAEVLSCPEPGLAIAGFGKRDVSYDIDLPVVLKVVARNGERSPAPVDVTVTLLNDQHAFLSHSGGLGVGDLVVCGISHPCTAFDKWSLLPLVDESGDVLGAVRVLA